MKKTKWTSRAILLGTALALAALASGCHSIAQDRYRAGLHAEMIPAKFKPTIEAMPVTQPATGSAKFLAVFWILPVIWPDRFSPDPNAPFGYGDWLRDAAVYEACKASGADILIAPRFTEERTTGLLWFFRSRKVSVEGFPAKITGAKEIPVEKWPLLFGPNSGTQVIRTIQ